MLAGAFFRALGWLCWKLVCLTRNWMLGLIVATGPSVQRSGWWSLLIL